MRLHRAALRPRSRGGDRACRVRAGWVRLGAAVPGPGSPRPCSRAGGRPRSRRAGAVASACSYGRTRACRAGLGSVGAAAPGSGSRGPRFRAGVRLGRLDARAAASACRVPAGLDAVAPRGTSTPLTRGWSCVPRPRRAGCGWALPRPGRARSGSAFARADSPGPADAGAVGLARPAGVRMLAASGLGSVGAAAPGSGLRRPCFRAGGRLGRPDAGAVASAGSCGCTRACRARSRPAGPPVRPATRVSARVAVAGCLSPARMCPVHSCPASTCPACGAGLAGVWVPGRFGLGRVVPGRSRPARWCRAVRAGLLGAGARGPVRPGSGPVGPGWGV
jgi:hypothetical protein